MMQTSPSSTNYLRVLQINLHHSKAASAALEIHISESGEDCILIQEPWVRNNKICGLQINDYVLFQGKADAHNRACILVKKCFNSFILFNFSTEDITSVAVEDERGTLWLTSAYLPYEDAIPTGRLQELVNRCNMAGQPLIIGADANAHHSLWGCNTNNKRGEYLYDFILNNNIVVCNRGNSPTFLNSLTSQIIDVTLTNSAGCDMVSNWHVLDKHSFSDHRYITFSISFSSITPVIPPNKRKMNWPLYRKILTATLPALQDHSIVSAYDLDSAVDTLTAACEKASRAACPSQVSNRRKMPCWWNAEISSARATARRSFNHAKNTGDWQKYRDNLRVFKRTLRKAKRVSWRHFTGEVENTSEASRLRKILASNPHMPSYIEKPDGSWSASSREVLESLFEKHFPGCSFVPRDSSSIPDYSPLTQTWSITGDCIAASIRSFDSFKSPGPDGIIPAELQEAFDILLPWLIIIYNGCLLLSHIPRGWRTSKVVFIPKAGKASHVKPNDFRPICLNSFLLKSLERILEEKIRASIKPGSLNKAQHAYSKGKSTETALHTLVHSIEKSMVDKNLMLAAFTDIEGAFNNILPDAILSELMSLKVDSSITRLVRQLLLDRVIVAELGCSRVVATVCRGTPQGGVLSPLLWNLAVNSLLHKLEEIGCNVVAYADDIVIYSSGIHAGTIRDIVQGGLNLLTRWCSVRGLGINPAKTEIVLFNRKHSTPLIQPLLINRVPLEVSSEAKFLGVILDRKLDWKSNVASRCNKALVALYTCKAAIGKKWGLNPGITYWIFTAVVRPILFYGVVVWWTALLKRSRWKPLEKVQRSACLLITGCLSTTPTKALFAMLDILPPDLMGRSIAFKAALRMNALLPWNNSIGHSIILMEHNVPISTDYCIGTNYMPRYKCMIPSREQWDQDCMEPEGVMKIYTDGSKMEGRVGFGVYAPSLCINSSHRIPDHCSVFQSEVIAINHIADRLSEIQISGEDIWIYSDSQAAVRSLSSNSFTSKVVRSCTISLNEIGTYNRVRILWIPGHRDFNGNCIADEFARQGSSLEQVDYGHDISVSINTAKYKSDSLFRELATIRWQNEPTCLSARLIWPSYNEKSSREFLSMDRIAVRNSTALITGHCLVGTHAQRIGVPTQDICPLCEDAEEVLNAKHLLCRCSALSRSRFRFLGNYLFTGLAEINSADILGLGRFARHIDHVLSPIREEPLLTQA